MMWNATIRRQGNKGEYFSINDVICRHPPRSENKNIFKEWRNLPAPIQRENENNCSTILSLSTYHEKLKLAMNYMNRQFTEERCRSLQSVVELCHNPKECFALYYSTFQKFLVSGADLETKDKGSTAMQRSANY